MSEWTTASEGELKAAAAAIEGEVQRRAAVDAGARAKQFRAELQEVRDGKRAVGDDHVAYLTPREVLAAVDRGQVPGVGADRRLARRR